MWNEVDRLIGRCERMARGCSVLVDRLETGANRLTVSCLDHGDDPGPAILRRSSIPARRSQSRRPAGYCMNTMANATNQRRRSSIKLPRVAGYPSVSILWWGPKSPLLAPHTGITAAMRLPSIRAGNY